VRMLLTRYVGSAALQAAEITRDAMSALCRYCGLARRFAERLYSGALAT